MRIINIGNYFNSEIRLKSNGSFEVFAERAGDRNCDSHQSLSQLRYVLGETSSISSCVKSSSYSHDVNSGGKDALALAISITYNFSAYGMHKEAPGHTLSGD